jgi:quinol monooxygenase YgiN
MIALLPIRGVQMPTIAAQITIGDYGKWRAVFDKHKPLRDKAGLLNVRVYQNADDPKELIIWSETTDVANAREALASQEIRSAMQEAGVVGPPKIHVIG